jgi:two-component system, sensor histidine kinase PdtaS
MRQRCLEMNRGPPPRGPIVVDRLLAENARLRRLCAEAKELASRHELALREGDHRIKNSLQIVASLMDMQERRETNPAARSALRAATARIQAVARMHDALQLNGSADAVNLGALIEKMCASLHEMAGDPLRVKVVVDAEAIDAPIRLAQPMVLAVNELVVNALRHAFPGERCGTISVALQCSDGELRVVIADDGTGLPADHSKSGGFGMKLVHMMAAKIGAKLHIESTKGSRFTLSAPYAAVA